MSSARAAGTDKKANSVEPGKRLLSPLYEIEKEIPAMKREQYYKNKRTGERTESHTTAMEWYKAKDEIEVWYFSEVCGEWLCGVEWVW